MTQTTHLNDKQIVQKSNKFAYSVKVIGKTYDFKLLSFFINTIKIIATSFFNTKNISIIALPKRRKYMTVLRSPHIYKKSQEHFLLQTNKLAIYCFFKNQKTADLFHKTIQRITFPGIEISIESSYLQ